MKYGIIKTTFNDQTTREKNIIGYTNSIDEYARTIKLQYPQIDMVCDTDLDKLKTNAQFSHKEYLVQNNKNIYLIEKIVEIDTGFWYNTERNAIKIKTKWQFIPVQFNIDNNAERINCSEPKRSNQNKLAIKEFNMKGMVQNSHTLIIGKRESGKTTLVTNILDRLDKKILYNSLIICCKSADIALYKERYPNTDVIAEYDSAAIEKFFNQKDIESGECIPGMIIFDDCLGSTGGTWQKDRIMVQLMFNSRHYKKGYIMCFQYPPNLKPEIRCNFDYVFLFGDDFISNQKKLFTNYAGMFPTFDTFGNIFTDLTKDHSSIVINNRTRETDITEKVFHYITNVE